MFHISLIKKIQQQSEEKNIKYLKKNVNIVKYLLIYK